ncbi:MAG TPA: hypothetical protein VFL93_03560, partial [Longimicrobiaceae bacterium]|nr:hypothetical protein [Longimicrobiaceae bacterium]
DAEGLASVRVRFGHVAGVGEVVVTAPTLGYQDTARYTVLPGAPARTAIEPRDTVVYLDGTITLRATVADRFGNRRPESPTITGSAGATVSGTTVRAAGFGVLRVRATFPGAASDSTTITALPRERLAATTAYLGGTLVMMDLDGSNRVSVPLQGIVYGLDWAPDGRVVVAPGSTTATLEAVSSTGEITPFLSNSTASSEAYPVFSADGKTLFFAGRAAGATNTDNYLWRANADGTGVQATTIPLTFEWGTSYGPSPDATQLVFRSTIYDLQTQTGKTLPTGEIESWRWSPLGDLIAFNDIDTMGVMRPDGTGRRVFSSDYTGFADQSIDWSGDGKYLVFRSNSGSLEIVEVATGAHAVLPFTSGFTQGALQ